MVGLMVKKLLGRWILFSVGGGGSVTQSVVC